MAVRYPPFLTRLNVENFRSLRQVDLSLGALNVLVGPNGAGKTNLLDVIDFLGDSVREDLGPALASRGGFDRVRFRGENSSAREPVKIEIEAAVTRYSSRTATDKYTLTFTAGTLRGRPERSDGRRLLRRSEEFLFKRTQGRGRRITINGSDLSIITDDESDTYRTLQEGSLGLSTLPRLGADEGGGSEQVEALAELFASFRVFNPDVNRIRQPYHEIESDQLQNDARNLAAFLYHLHQISTDTFSALEKDAQSFIPGLRYLDFDSAGGASKATVLKLVEKGLKGATDLAEASFGSVRALSLLALLYDPRPPKLTCIEEIDHGLHPYVLDRLVELLRSASKRTQLLIATHSPPLVNRLAAPELVVCERGDDAASHVTHRTAPRSRSWPDEDPEEPPEPGQGSHRGEAADPCVEGRRNLTRH